MRPWLNDLGAPHSDTLRLIERFRPVAVDDSWSTR
jgi:hypothetical protein